MLSRRQGSARCYSTHELCLRHDATPGHDYRGNLNRPKTRDDAIRQVVDAQTLVVSLRSQIDQAQLALQAGGGTLKLSEERKEFAVGNVLETV